MFRKIDINFPQRCWINTSESADPDKVGAAKANQENNKKGENPMKRVFESPEVSEIGKAEDVILGGKIPVTPYDSEDDPAFQQLMDDSDE